MSGVRKQPQNYWYVKLAGELEEVRRRLSALEGKAPPVINLAPAVYHPAPMEQPDPPPQFGDAPPVFAKNLFKL